MKKTWKFLSLVVTAFAALFFLQVDSTNAHGYIKSPESRSYKASLAKQTLGYTTAFEKYGSVINAPQSVEGLKGFPVGGPVDGRIASGNGGSGQIDFVLDNQSATRWDKITLTGGLQTFTWNYTAPHATSKWHYYITKPSWNPNQPLSRNDFELLSTVPHDGSAASNNLSHVVNIPTDREGYHIILGVWDIADTGNAFYQVIDVNLQNDVTPDTEAPTAPTNLRAFENEFAQVVLTWNASSDNRGVKEYQVFRDGERIGTTSSPQWVDDNVQPNSTYTYSVQAIDTANNVSPKSADISFITKDKPENDRTPPTAPGSLHSMGATGTTVELMWSASSDASGIKEYQVFRNGTLVATTTSTSFTDSTLEPGNTYSYFVKAVDVFGNVSPASNTLELTTPGASGKEWRADQVYTAGDVVLYNGNEYEALWWTQGSQPDKLNGWKLLTMNESLTWQADAAYVGGTVVEYEGKTYRAKWWTMGDVPSALGVWELVR